MNQTSLSNQALILIAGKISAFAFSFFVPIALVRLYSQEQYGLFQQVLLIFNTFFAVLQLGMVNSLLYFYPRDLEKRKALLSQTFFFLLAAGILFGISLFIFQNQIADYFNNPKLKPILPLLGIYLLLMLVSSFLEILFIVEGNALKASALIFFTGFLRFCFLIGASLILRDVFALLSALTGIAVLRVTILIFYLSKNYNLSFGNFNRDYFLSQLKYSLPFGLAGIFVILTTTIDKYFISYFYDSEVYAIYAIGCFQVPIVALIFDPVIHIILPRISKLHKESDISKMHNLWQKAASKLSLLGFPLFVLCFILANQIVVFLFTENYKDSVPIFMIYLLLLPRQTTNYGVILRAYGETKYISKTCFASLAVAATLMLPSIKAFGISGPPMVVVFSLYLTAYLQLSKTRKLLKVNWLKLLPWNDFLRNFAAAALIGLIVYYAISSISLSPLFSILLSSLLFFTIYITVACRCQFLADNDKKIVADFLSKAWIKLSPSS